MKKGILVLIYSIIVISCSNKEKANNENDLFAENLWGEKINITKKINSDKPTVIIPFSTSNCGYCLIDGYFVEKNYIENNNSFGGFSFHQCLFNPQLDIYAFQKHFKWNSDVLTYPPTLHKFHENGFPSVLAFKNGKQVLKNHSDYANIDTLNSILWNNTKHLIPTSDFQMVNATANENEFFATVQVYPKGKKIPQERIDSGKKWKSNTCKNIDSLTTDDLDKHLIFIGNFSFNEMSSIFKNKQMPIKFENDSILIGEYSFKHNQTGIRFICPNPYNKEKYLLLYSNNGNTLYNKNENIVKQFANYLDYIIYTGSDKSSKRLLYGHFDKSDLSNWSFSEQLSFSEVNKSNFCKNKCEIPRKKVFDNSNSASIKHTETTNIYGEQYSFGNSNCKFPDIICDDSNNIWVAWGENGDINLAKIADDNSIISHKIENNLSDSYNAKLSFINNKLWIFYVNNKDNYYRLYGKTFDGLRLSDEILISHKEPYDIVIPTVASNNKDEITIAWSEWRANNRILKYRKIKNNVELDIKDANVCPPEYTKDYINAWYPSLCYDDSNQVWGAWNQHYPAIFGICGGKLNEIAKPITKSEQKEDDWETGGYPSIFTNGKEKFIVWEGDGWDTYDEKAQRILFSKYDDSTNKWSIGEIISVDNQTFINQTPSGTIDENENIWVVYSGRPKGIESKWGIYLVSNNNSKWTKPILISDKNDTARHPKIITDKKGNLWVSWHNGIGKNMKINILKIDKKLKLTLYNRQ